MRQRGYITILNTRLANERVAARTLTTSKTPRRWGKGEANSHLRASPGRPKPSPRGSNKRGRKADRPVCANGRQNVGGFQNGN